MRAPRMVIGLLIPLMLSSHVMHANAVVKPSTYHDDIKQKLALQCWGFDGQLTDQKMHWQFLGKGYRAYNPVLHRFMAQDRSSPFNKGGRNGYIFSNNNPVMQYDPTGHFSINQLFPQTWGGVAGVGISTVLGIGMGALSGGLAGLPFTIFMGAGLGATGQALGDIIDNKQPGLDVAAAAGIGAGIGAASHMIAAAGKYFLTSSVEIEETERFFKVRMPREKALMLPKLSRESIDSVGSPADESVLQGYSAEKYSPGAIADEHIHLEGGKVGDLFIRGEELKWDGPPSTSERDFLILPEDDARNLLRLRTRRDAYLYKVDATADSGNYYRMNTVAHTTPSQALGTSRQVRRYLADICADQYPLSEQGRRMWLDHNW